MKIYLTLFSFLIQQSFTLTCADVTAQTDCKDIIIGINQYKWLNNTCVSMKCELLTSPYDGQIYDKKACSTSGTTCVTITDCSQIDNQNSCKSVKAGGKDCIWDTTCRWTNGKQNIFDCLLITISYDCNQLIIDSDSCFDESYEQTTVIFQVVRNLLLNAIVYDMLYMDVIGMFQKQVVIDQNVKTIQMLQHVQQHLMYELCMVYTIRCKYFKYFFQQSK